MTEPKLVLVPTYNERGNVEALARQLLALEGGFDVLFVDDDSPDGTGKVLDELAAGEPRLRVIHRPGKAGVGAAHKHGIAWAYERGYRVLVTMDADFTHRPEDVSKLLHLSGECDVVVGSRYIFRDSLKEWNAFRWSLTRLGNLLTRVMLRMPYDATGALRLYRLDRIPRRLFAAVESDGYAFFFESLLALHNAGLRIEELPIVLPARTYGTSKMSVAEPFKSLLRILRLYVKGPSAAGLGSTEPGLWDEYWGRKRSSSGMLYGAIASVYRRLIIRRALNAALSRRFAPGSLILHAGCGSGQVDVDVSRAMKVVALDVSPPALRLYRESNGSRGALVLADILRLPLADASFEGAYNLGVMEHFTREDIRAILGELRRVIKPGGGLVIFWPARFSLSVAVLGAAHFVLNRVLRRGVTLHPRELTLVRSRRHVQEMLGEAGFRLDDYAFGARDLFSQVVVTATRT